MERRSNQSSSYHRKRLDDQFYTHQQQLQQPPPPELQLQPLSQVPAYLQTQPNLNKSSVSHRHDLRELANKLDVSNGGLPPGSIEVKRKRPKTIGVGDKQRGVKLVQRGFKFTEEQRQRLNDSFASSRYPKPHEMEVLAYELNVRKDQIKNWFHDQRRKYKNIVVGKKNSPKKTMFSAQQRKRLEDFFEKNFHPYPGDSKRLVKEFEFREDQVHFRYEEVPLRYDCLNSEDKNVQSRGFKFSEDQRVRLRYHFNKNRYPNPYDMERMAQELHVKKEQVKNWFHDQRRKMKRENSIL